MVDLLNVTIFWTGKNHCYMYYGLDLFAKQKTMSKKKKGSAINLDYAKRFKLALIDYGGLSELQISLLMAQAAHETGGFQSKHALSENNFGGIKYNYTLRKVSTPSFIYLAPAREDKNKIKRPYARFNNVSDFVKTWIPRTHLIDTRTTNTIGAPLQATNLVDYNHRLSLNGYYQTGENFPNAEENYYKDLIAWGHVLQRNGLIESNPALNNALFGNSIANIQHDGPAINGSDLSNFFGVPGFVMDNQSLEKSNFIKNRNEKQIASPTFEITKGLNALEIALPSLGIGGLAIAGITEAGKIVAKTIYESEKRASNNIIKQQRYKHPEVGRLPINKNSIVLPSVDNTWKPNLLTTLPFAEKMLVQEVKPVDKISYPSDKPANHSKDFYKKNSSPTNRKVLENKPDAYNRFKSFQQQTNTDQGKSMININLNKPMIENFTIHVKDATEGINDLKQKVEEVLLEILNNANVV